jgi:hypothetical protein
MNDVHKAAGKCIHHFIACAAYRCTKRLIYAETMIGTTDGFPSEHIKKPCDCGTC